jgi:hypothetical protein
VARFHLVPDRGESRDAIPLSDREEPPADGELLEVDGRWWRVIGPYLDARSEIVSDMFWALPANPPPPPKPPVSMRVTLSNGSTHRIRIAETDPKTAALRLTTTSPPFTADWLEAEDGELIRTSAIISARVENPER